MRPSSLLAALLCLTGQAVRRPLMSPPVIAPACDRTGLVLPPGFCAVRVSGEVPRVRQLVVLANGDVLAAGRAGITLLRDRDGDGVADLNRVLTETILPRFRAFFFQPNQTVHYLTCWRRNCRHPSMGTTQ